MRTEIVLKSLLHLLFLPSMSLGVLTVLTMEARADTINYYNTGVADDGSLLAAGASDTHYQLVSSADANGTTAVATLGNPAWTESATAGWISPGADGSDAWSSGNYTYESTFDLTGYDPTSAIFSGAVAADNSVAIYLNGSDVATFTGEGFSYFTTFSIPSGFVSGLNRVDFVVFNDGGPTGLNVDNATITATAETPEPGSILLLGTGLLSGLSVLGRRLRLTPRPARRGAVLHAA